MTQIFALITGNNVLSNNKSMAVLQWTIAAATGCDGWRGVLNYLTVKIFALVSVVD